jgi:hypothetical protein
LTEVLVLTVCGGIKLRFLTRNAPTAKTSHPKHCTHKRIGQSYVRINGRQIFTGTLVKRKISTDAEKEYRRIIVEYLANQDRPAKPSSITLDEVCVRFLKAKRHLTTTHYENYKTIIKIMLAIH